LDQNLGSSQFKADPFPYYRRLRDESPVHRVKLPDGQTAWLITRYDDVVTVLKDERFAKDRSRAQTQEQLAALPWVPKAFLPLTHHMLDKDPPDHTRLRALVQQAFSPRLVEGMRSRIESIADELFSRVARRGRMDLVSEYALPIPTMIIAEMLGVPIKDRHRFHRWSTVILTSTATRFGLYRAMPSIWLFMRYVRKLIRTRRADPRDDLVSALIQARDAADSLSDDELLSMILLLIMAGHETTVNLIASGVLALLEHPDQMDRLRRDPTLIRTAVEELLRFTAPVETATELFASDVIDFHGVRIAKGELVLAVIASANRDERQFVDPDRLDVSREPNKHVAFGQGIHFCLGASLARLEAQVALGTLLARTDDLQLAVKRETLQWRPGLVLRGLWALPVRFVARSATEPAEAAGHSCVSA
jgi:cytochrome P450 PksS